MMSATWQKVKLGDVCQAINTGPFGSQLHQHDYSLTGTPVVMPKDIVDGRVSEDGIARVSDEHIKRLSRHQVVAGDLLFSRRGDVGRCALIGQRENGWLCGTGCLRVQLDVEKVFPPFVFRSMCLSESVKWLEGHAVGSTMPNINASILSDVPVSFPPLPVQKKIAAILSAYDDLIENNRRRIAILEEMARKVYRRRFGGKKVNGTIADVCEEIRRSVKPGEIDSETPYIGLEHMPRRSISLCDWESAEKVTSTKHGFKEGEILFGKIRPYFHKVGLAFVDGVASSDAIVIRPLMPELRNYVLLTVSSDDFVAAASQGMKEGSKMPRADWDLLLKYPILIPNEDDLNRFNEVIEPMMEQLKALCFANRKLAAARDALLPKLMDGFNN